MLEFLKRGVAFLLIAVTALSASALKITLDCMRYPDSYSSRSETTWDGVMLEGPVWKFGNIVVRGNEWGVAYNKGKILFSPYSQSRYLTIENLPYVSNCEFTREQSGGFSMGYELSDPFKYKIQSLSSGRCYITSAFNVTYGERFLYEIVQYTLLTDFTAKVDECIWVTSGGKNNVYERASIEVLPFLEFAKNGFYDVTVTTIDTKAFANLSKLTKVILPTTIKTIKSGAFSNSPNLTTVVVKATTPPTLSPDAFDASALQNVVVEVPAGSYSLYKSAPVWKDMNIIPSGDSVAIDGIKYSVTSDGIALVTGFDSAMETATVPSSVAVNGKDCTVAVGLIPSQTTTNLKSLYLGEDVAIQSLWNKCVPNLKKIFYLGTSAPAVSSDAMTSFANTGVQVYGASSEVIADIVSQTGGTPRVYPMLKNRFTADGIVYIPTSTAGRICDAVDYDYLTANPSMEASATYRNVTFTIENINPYVFHQAKALSTLTINNSLLIPSNFATQTSVTSMELTCGEISAEAFMSNASLEELTIDNTGSVGTSAFANSTNLKKLTINSKGNVGESAFANSGTALDSEGAEIEVNNTGVISTGAFRAFGPIATLHIGENVTAIMESAFENAFSGNVNGSVEIECTGSIGAKAFYNTHNIISLTIAESVTGIGAEAFSSAMTGNKATATLNNSGTIAENAFSNNDAMAGVEIGDNCRTMGAGAFSNNNALTTVTVGDGCTTIGDGAFSSNLALESVTLGNGVETLGDEVFKGDSALKEVTFGTGLKTLGAYVFDNCTSMQTLTVWAVEPPVCGSYDFRHIDTWSCELLVKRSSINAYAVAPQWNEFLNIAAIFDPNEVTGIVVDPESGLGDIFTNGLELFVNDSEQVLVKVEPATASAELKWESSDDAVATVDNSGLVTGVGAGEADITITAGDFSRAFTVKVSKRKQTIIWDQEFPAIYEGDSVELTATASSGLDVEYLIISGDASVSESTLTVYGSGKITIEASQPGNDEYLAAESIQRSLNAILSGTDISMADGSLFRIEGRELLVLSGGFELFNLQGVLIRSGIAPVRISLTPNETYILCINNRKIKLMMK